MACKRCWAAATLAETDFREPCVSQDRFQPALRLSQFRQNDLLFRHAAELSDQPNFRESPDYPF